MKRTWVVHVGSGVGHEYHGHICFSEWYGPYTQEVAEKLEGGLNKQLHYLPTDGVEGLCATAMPLDCLSRKELLEKYGA